MSLKNVAICISPCIMRAEVVSMADMIYASKVVMVTTILIS
jgi:hypothetical protein